MTVCELSQGTPARQHQHCPERDGSCPRLRGSLQFLLLTSSTDTGAEPTAKNSCGNEAPAACLPSAPWPPGRNKDFIHQDHFSLE